MEDNFTFFSKCRNLLKNVPLLNLKEVSNVFLKTMFGIEQFHDVYLCSIYDVHIKLLTTQQHSV